MNEYLSNYDVFKINIFIFEKVVSDLNILRGSYFILNTHTELWQNYEVFLSKVIVLLGTRSIYLSEIETR